MVEVNQWLVNRYLVVIRISSNVFNSNQYCQSQPILKQKIHQSFKVTAWLKDAFCLQDIRVHDIKVNVSQGKIWFEIRYLGKGIVQLRSTMHCINRS